jgi:hypothetical protein
MGSAEPTSRVGFRVIQGCAGGPLAGIPPGFGEVSRIGPSAWLGFCFLGNNAVIGWELHFRCGFCVVTNVMMG